MLEYIILFLFICYLISRYTCGRSDSQVCLIGKTAIVTGGNAGIGLETVLNLASRGCRVILADISDMEETKKEIIRKTHNSNIETKYLNLASLKSVREFAEDINKNEEKIDILINNAGIGSSFGKFTEDGLPFVMQVNYYGHFLLTHLLVDKLKKSDDPRIIFVSSFMALLSNSTLKNMKENLSFFEYCNSKLCLAIASTIFAAKLKQYRFSVNALHPGATRTAIFLRSLSRNEILNGLWVIQLYFLSRLFGKRAEEGAQTTIHLATSNQLKHNSGKYYSDCKVFPFSLLVPRLRNREFCNKVWSLSEELVGLQPCEKL